jgi:cathepsin X
MLASSLLLTLPLIIQAKPSGYVKYEGDIVTKVLSPEPHSYVSMSDLPEGFDWRNINGTNFCSRTLNQKNPNVCGSCWAEAVTGALSDRYIIATNGHAQIQLAPQVLINFNARTTGGSCNGGDHLKAYEFMHKYGMVDDTCAPFHGLNWLHGFDVAAMTGVKAVQNHMCYTCDWDDACGYIKGDNFVNYRVDEFGEIKGEQQMMAEIYARGPIACLINSEADSFDSYRGGIIQCDSNVDPVCAEETDHVVVIAGWGVQKSTGLKYWVGRNSYGTQWGEGSGGGWFRIERGTNTLGLEGDTCTWATPAADVVAQLNQAYDDSL